MLSCREADQHSDHSQHELAMDPALLCRWWAGPGLPLASQHAAASAAAAEPYCCCSQLVCCGRRAGCRFGSGVGRSLLTIVSAVAVDFLALGCLIATLGWGVANRLLRRKMQHSHAVEQSVEW